MSRSLELLTDACGGLRFTVRKMFGGHGFFAPNGGMFAGIVTDDEVILKLPEGAVRDELTALGGHAWVYERKPKLMTMSSWIVVPEGFYDDPELFSQWAAKAHALAPSKLKQGKKPSTAKRKAPTRGTVHKARRGKRA